MSAQQAQQHYQQMSMQIGTLRQKISELEGEKYEHELVIKTIDPMSDERKCYRLIGGVLVERTKKEVLPAVQTNLEQITQLIERLQQQLIELEQAALDFRKQHDLQAAGPRPQDDDDLDEDAKDKKPTGLLA